MSPAAAPASLAECVSVLHARRIAVCAELADRAGAVPACDADYNALIAERAELAAAIARLEPLARAETRVPHPRED